MMWHLLDAELQHYATIFIINNNNINDDNQLVDECRSPGSAFCEQPPFIRVSNESVVFYLSTFSRTDS